MDDQQTNPEQPTEPERKIDCTEGYDVNGNYIHHGGGLTATTLEKLAEAHGVRIDQLNWKPIPAMQKRAAQLEAARRTNGSSDDEFWLAFHCKE